MLSAIHEQDFAVRFLRRVLEGAWTSPLLVVGPEGTGRRFAARQLTQELFCQGTKEEGCSCIDCHQIHQGVHTDLVEISAAEKDIGVDVIREVIELASSNPSMARYRVFILDGVDRMTSAAANAFLKTLEEPPSTARFFLIAESVGSVLPTLRSRCGLVQFNPMREAFVLDKIQQFEPDATKALVYTRMGEGSIGRSLQYWGSGRIALRDKAVSLLRFSAQKDVASLFSLVDSLEKELPLLLRFVDQVIHDLLMLHVAPSKLINLDLHEPLRSLGVGVGLPVWSQLRVRLQDARQTYRKVKINLPFHVKSICVETFGV